MTLPPPFPQMLSSRRGDTIELELTLLHAENENAFDLTGASAIFTLKAVDPFSKRVNLNPAVVTLSTEDLAPRITISDTPTSGIIEVDLVPADTQLLEPGSYRFDIQVTDVTGRVFTPIMQDLYLSEDITRPP